MATEFVVTSMLTLLAKTMARMFTAHFNHSSELMEVCAETHYLLTLLLQTYCNKGNVCAVCLDPRRVQLKFSVYQAQCSLYTSISRYPVQYKQKSMSDTLREWLLGPYDLMMEFLESRAKDEMIPCFEAIRYRVKETSCCKQDATARVWDCLWDVLATFTDAKEL